MFFENLASTAKKKARLFNMKTFSITSEQAKTLKSGSPTMVATCNPNGSVSRYQVVLKDAHPFIIQDTKKSGVRIANPLELVISDPYDTADLQSGQHSSPETAMPIYSDFKRTSSDEELEKRLDAIKKANPDMKQYALNRLLYEERYKSGNCSKTYVYWDDETNAPKIALTLTEQCALVTDALEIIK